MNDEPKIKVIPIPGRTARDRSQYVKNYMADREGMDAWRRDLLPDVYRSEDGRRLILVSGPRGFKERYADRAISAKIV
jgi:hypothetical protein